MLAGYPVKGVRVRLVDGQHHSVDSSEIAFKLAGVQAMKQALELAEPVLLEPIMLVTLSVPEAHVGDVIGDLNSRRGRPQGMEPIGAMTEIKAEVPMSEMLTYAPDLRSITAGQGDYTLEFLRYEELPGHLAQKVVEQAGDGARPGSRVGPALHTWAPARSSHPSPTWPASCAPAGCCGASSTRSSWPPDGRRTVCELCAPRAADAGWVRERDGQADMAPVAAPRRGRGLLERLRLGSRAGEPRRSSRPRPAPAARAREPPQRSRAAPLREPGGGRQPAGPGGRAAASAAFRAGAAPPGRPRRSSAPPRSSTRASTRAGWRALMRSLGAPAVCIRPAEHLAGAIHVTRRLGAVLVPLRSRPHRGAARGAAARAGHGTCAAVARGAARQRARGRRRHRLRCRGVRTGLRCLRRPP